MMVEVTTGIDRLESADTSCEILQHLTFNGEVRYSKVNCYLRRDFDVGGRS